LPTTTWRVVRDRALVGSGLAVSGVVQSFSYPTLRVGDRPEEKGYWDGGWALLETDTADYPYRVISWDGADTFSLSGSSANVPPGSLYVLWRQASWPGVDEALRQALRQVWEVFVPPVVKSFPLRSSQFRYPISPEIEAYKVWKVEVQPLEAYVPDYPYVEVEWRYYGNGQEIELPPELVWPYSGRELRIWGAPPFPSPLLPTTGINLELPGDEVLLIRYLVGAIINYAGELGIALEIGDVGQAPQRIPLGKRIQAEAVSELLTRRRHLLRRGLRLW